jgi:hypothetical protein
VSDVTEKRVDCGSGHLQEVRPRAPCVLAATMARGVALTALASLGLSGAPFHEPFHADWRQRSMIVTKCSDRDLIAAMPKLWTSGPATPATSACLLVSCTAELGRIWIKAAPAAPLDRR